MNAAHYSKNLMHIWGIFSHYNHEKYWEMRDYVISHPKKMKSYIYLFRIKKMDSWNNASFGTHIKYGCAFFAKPPHLPHGLNGIIISNGAVIGENCTIFHQVTIGNNERMGGAPTIGDNVLIGAGAKIIGPIHIGDNVRIGAGCIVAVDIPDNCTVVMDKPRILCREQSNISK